MSAAKLSRRTVAWARREASAGRPISAIADELGLVYRTVWAAVVGNSWAWFQEPPPVAKSRVLGSRECVNCAMPVDAEDCYVDRCHNCYMYWRAHGVERPLRLWKKPPPGIDRAGWRQCERCQILIPGRGLCEWCEAEDASRGSDRE